jgi:hypothetical protein
MAWGVFTLSKRCYKAVTQPGEGTRQDLLGLQGAEFAQVSFFVLHHFFWIFKKTFPVCRFGRGSGL